jgi:hypothetical protein
LSSDAPRAWLSKHYLDLAGVSDQQDLMVLTPYQKCAVVAKVGG